MSSPRIVSKLPQVGTTIFSVIGDLAARHPSINLSQGAPSFPCDPELIRVTHEAMLAGENQYAPMTGLPALREQLAAKIATSYGHHYDAGEEVTITASASEALFCAITALVHPGDEVIMFEPAFDSYRPMIQLQGATPVVIALKAPYFAIPWDEVAARITPRTRMIVLNTPHNPTGTVWQAGRGSGAPGPPGARHRHPDPLGRGVRARGVRRRSAPERDPLSGSGRTLSRRLLLRQDLPRHRLAGGLLRGAAPPDGGDPQGAPVRHVRRRHPHAVRLRPPVAATGPLPGAGGLLSAQAGSAGLGPGGFALYPAPLGGQLLYAGELRAGKRRAGQPVRAAAHS
ncbi:putative aminotransferase [Aeromonas salmonicida subsp. salmonicida 01-B526]|uniref:Aminotransferase n=1 Tax=Aeromonas salmonicida subsp. salmonicida 01-B526 TaxID=1076135 RepID=A0ABP2N5C7_AERSS|nr:putative aminotransferase [Aeromonas salmonicida subsp. salmonicida 01-B526]